MSLPQQTKQRVLTVSVPPCLALAAALLLLPAADASAANRWLTSRTVNGRTQPLAAGIDSSTAWVNSNGLINLTISFYHYPRGDNNGNTQFADAGSREQDTYEWIIQHFADAVYEMTEGAHAVRRVVLYRNGSFPEADVLWQHAGHPNAWPLSQEGIAANINMYDYFDLMCFTNDFLNLYPGGYTLSHEWGHYFYGLFDEYCCWSNRDWQTLSADDQTQPCIMTHERRASNVHFEWLNCSIRYNGRPFADYECRPRTAQYQFYGNGGWPMLARNPTNDPVDTPLLSWWRSYRGTRMHYPELAAVAPVGRNSPRIDLDATIPATNRPSRAHLDIRWRGTNFIFTFALPIGLPLGRADTLNTARLVIQHLIEQVPDGSAVGILAFNDAVQTVAPLTVITGAADRVTLQHAMDNLTPQGDKAALGDALQAALAQIKSFGWSDEQAAVLVLCDGAVNAGADPLAAIPGFQDEQIPIMTLGSGDAQTVDPRLATLAKQTGGRYFYAPGGLAQLAEGYQNAFAEITSRPKPAQGRWRQPVGQPAPTVSIPFEVEPALRELNVTVGYELSNTALQLRAPNGQLYAPTSIESTAIEELIAFAVPQPQAGTWTLTGLVANGVTLNYQVHAAVTGFTYHLAAVCPQGETAMFPAPVQLVARLRRETAINGATVTAALTDSRTNINVITMDNVAAGLYKATLLLSNGLYNVAVGADNGASVAQQTWADGLPSATETGEVPVPPPDEPLAAAFSRAAPLQITVTGVPDSLAAPAPPAQVLAGKGDGYDFVPVSWAAVSNASIYEVWRATGSDSAAAVKIGETIYTCTNWPDTNTTVGVIYTYWVKARNLKGTSAFGAGDQGWMLLGPDILVNERPTLSVATGEFVEVSARLRAGPYTGVPCDWWVAAVAALPEGVYLFYMNSSLQWVPAAEVADFRPICQGPIFDIESYVLWSCSSLPVGVYYFYFGLDPLDGELDLNNLVCDRAVVTVSPTSAVIVASR